jgi:hypothetical protein
MALAPLWTERPHHDNVTCFQELEYKSTQLDEQWAGERFEYWDVVLIPEALVDLVMEGVSDCRAVVDLLGSRHLP